jgi:site-specific DNA-methyltransferase (adenine-specific)
VKHRVEKIGDCTLYLGDCLEILPTLGKVDAVVTDPPYGVNFKYEGHDDTNIGYAEWCKRWKAALDLVTDGPIAISCGMANLQEWPAADWVFCWHKPASMGRCFVGFNFRAPIVPDKTLGGHPCPKPLGWGVELVSRLTKPGDATLDPFMGSGTTLVACAKLGRRGIGIEREEKYFDIACERVRMAYDQPDLFVPAPEKPVQEGLL